jgi:hypothetical protein
MRAAAAWPGGYVGSGNSLALSLGKFVTRSHPKQDFQRSSRSLCDHIERLLAVKGGVKVDQWGGVKVDQRWRGWRGSGEGAAEGEARSRILNCDVWGRYQGWVREERLRLLCLSR